LEKPYENIYWRVVSNLGRLLYTNPRGGIMFTPLNILALIQIIILLALVVRKYLASKPKQKAITMHPFVPVEPTIQAAQITETETVTTTLVTFDDGTTATIRDAAVIGDYAIQNADGTLKVVDKATFEAQFKAA
jgi:hypothetical protein